MKKPSMWVLPGALALALFTLGPLAAQAGVLPPLKAFLVFASSAVPAAVSVLLGVYALVRGRRPPGSAAVALGLLPLVTIGLNLARARNYPRINDITTNLDNPPALLMAAAAPDNNGKDLRYPDEFRPLVRDAYPDLISLQLPLPSDQAFALVRQVAERHAGWRLTRVDAPALTLEGEESSGLFRFTDDFVVRVAALDGRSQVDMRSRSRVGKGDFGVNANRIRAYFAALAGQAQSPAP